MWRSNSRRVGRLPLDSQAMKADASDPTTAQDLADAPSAATGQARPSALAALGTDCWVVLPTYDEADNIGPISTAILDALPSATLLVVDDGSPDGTGDLADRLAAGDVRIRVRHRAAKEGL